MAKLLVAEDELLVRMMVVETLELAGHSVLAAGDGEAAFELFQKSPDIDLIVTDIRMPRVDGFALASRARRLRPNVGLLFMTGYTGSDVPTEFATVKTIQKPFDPDALESAIDNALKAAD